MACLQILLDKGEQEDWFTSHAMTALALIAVIFLSLFVVYELVVAHPVVHLRVFKNRTYATGVFMMTTLGFVLYGSLVLLPIMLQTLLMYPALQAGIATAPRGIGSLLFMPVVGLMISRVGARKLLVFGITAAGLTLIWLSVLNLDAGYWDFFWPQFIQGIAMSCLFVPLTTITMDPIPKQEMGNATSLFNLMRNIGGSMGIAVSATLLSRHRQMHTNILGAHVNPYDLQTQNRLSQLQAAMMAQGSDATTAARRAAALMFYTVERQAAMLSFIDVFRLLGIVFLFTLPLVMLMRSPRVGRRGESPGVH
jgi:DHA2 family multidrug resistance protein